MDFAIALLAVLLDLALGDPRRLYHPVRALGALMDREEAIVRSAGGLSLKWWGILFVLFNALGAWLVVRLLTSIPVLGWLIALYLAYTGLALGQLWRDGRRVARLIDAGDLSNARLALAHLVTRDTSAMDEQALRRSLAETMSENMNDGFVAPFFYLVIGGPALLWLYKTVSTMDSMWGYKTERYREFGWAAARTDDVLAFLPARMTAFFMLGAGWFMSLDVHRAFDNMRTDALKTESPNAGWPMSAAAWLLGAWVGGPAVYFGRLKDKPVLGPTEGAWSSIKTKRLLRMILATGFVSTAALAAYFAMLFAAA
ncbi:adenosylcobinamide-phosphate synthase CbiB [Desulfocurvibacter africanus]|uniref:adenosylcobinamide-phosphate synthase CbiB n=1 Tax=Desulfocurvibacter africanus TaxID=873 RepID=UPI0004165ED8|nr:adenosylcobinamide-phosphate synthase CbiB [Desulfocurvibacter africanus]